MHEIQETDFEQRRRQGAKADHGSTLMNTNPGWEMEYGRSKMGPVVSGPVVPLTSDL